jgi:uncharacterized protein YjbI with pentapeptide repeats
MNNYLDDFNRFVRILPQSVSSARVANQPIYVDSGQEPDEVNLLNSRQSDIHQEKLPEPYNKLTSQQARNEFKDFWKLVQSIKANPNAHKSWDEKRLITTEPLKLNDFFKDHDAINFNLSTFLKEHQITLTWALLDGAELNGANLNDAELNWSELNGAKLNGAKLNGAKLNDARLNGAELNDAELKGAWLYGAKLKNAWLNNAWLNNAKLNWSELNGAKLNDAKLNDAKLNDAKLNDAELKGAELNDAELKGAELNRAKLNGAQLNRAKLNRAELTVAELKGAQLKGAELNGAELNGARLNNETFFDGNTQLKNIKVPGGIVINGQVVKDQNTIKEFFIQQGAGAENISFALAA